MPLEPRKFETLRRAGDLAGMVDFFIGSSEADRRALENVAPSGVRNARFRRAPNGIGSAADGSKWDSEVYHNSRIAAIGAEKRVSNGLSCEGKFGIFEELI